MPALVIYVWEGFIRRNILSEIIKNGDSQRMTVNEYLTGYYIGNKIFFNWSWMIMLLLATIICIIIQSGLSLIHILQHHTVEHNPEWQ